MGDNIVINRNNPANYTNLAKTFKRFFTTNRFAENIKYIHQR